MVKIQPFGNRVVVEVIAPEQIIGGLVIPSSKETSNKGVVVALGDGDEIKNIQIGDVVIFVFGTGLNYTTDKKDYRVLGIKDIIGKIVEGEE